MVFHDHYAQDQLTAWFGGNISPVRPGRYELKLASSPDIADGWFDGGRWQVGFAGEFSPLIIPRDRFQWRGLNFEAKETPRPSWPGGLVFDWRKSSTVR